MKTRKEQYRDNREREQELLWSILRSRDKYHLLSLLFSEMLKDITSEDVHSNIEMILEASKNEVAEMLLNYRRNRIGTALDRKREEHFLGDPPEKQEKE